MEWRDLLRVPYLEDGDDPATGLDCYGQAAEVLRRLGLRMPPLPGRLAGAPSADLGAALEHLGVEAHLADRDGDLLVGDPEGRGYPCHLSVIVDARLGTALSTSRYGPYAWPRHRVPHEHGAWRARA